MTAGANPTASSGGSDGSPGIWGAYSASIVPGVYALLACAAWLSSPGANGIGIVEIVSAIALAALAIAIPVMKLQVGNRQDYFGGLGLVFIGLFALWAARDLPGMRGFAFGPGTAPRGFGIILLLLGAGIGLSGLLVVGSTVEKFAVRGPLFIVASTFAFAASIRPLGLVFASFVSIVISAAATTEVRWVETIIWAAVLTLFCCLLFPVGLNLPLQLWPNGYDPIQFLRSMR